MRYKDFPNFLPSVLVREVEGFGDRGAICGASCKEVVYVAGGRIEVRTDKGVFSSIDVHTNDDISNVRGKNFGDDINIPIVVRKNEVRDFLKCGFDSIAVKEILQSVVVVEGDPSVLPYVNFSP